jgi:hypothetical protein
MSRPHRTGADVSNRFVQLHRTLRKRLSVREIGRMAGRMAMRVPALAEPFGIARHGATYAEAADRVLSETAYDEAFDVEPAVAAFLDRYAGELGPLWDGRTLRVAARVGVYAIRGGEIRMATGALRQVPPGRLLAATRIADRLKAQRPTRHRSRVHIPGPVIPLVGSPTGRGNYYHFVCERFRLVLHALARCPELRRATLVVRAGMPGYHQAFYAGLARAYPALTIRELPPTVLVTCDELVGVLRNDPHPIGHFAGHEDFAALRALYRAAYEIPEGTPARRIYLSRASVRKRHILNEPALLETLAPHRFEVIEAERLPHRDQIALFGSAELIVGPSGAAFTNLVFASPGAKVIEICPPDLQEPFFVAAALQAGLVYRNVDGSRSGLYECFTVEPAAVLEAVER